MIQYFEVNTASSKSEIISVYMMQYFEVSTNTFSLVHLSVICIVIAVIREKDKVKQMKPVIKIYCNAVNLRFTIFLSD